MCEPATITAALAIASTALSIGGSVVNYTQQAAVAKANRENATAAYAFETAALTDRQAQEDTAAAQRTFESQREFHAARATARTAAGESGLSGISVDALLNDLTGQQAVREKAIEQNRSAVISQLQEEKRGADFARTSRINAVQKPSALGLGLEIAGHAVEGAQSYQKTKKPR